ncbi:Threonine synthase-like 2-like [Homarus americanus]|uniref:Threonine synthase-like 2-like n=1 Tax=Homarus americanus TaxID=6706 RepID=A0A8J5JVX2_HOMAM|nr:Threonine synthase-like 2-like [Homarus americanus]
MKYCSTRGLETGLSFKDVLFSGYAKDGGLYMPDTIPALSKRELEQWREHTYPELMYAIGRKFIDPQEIPDKDLDDIVNSSLQRFKIPEVVRIEHLQGGLNIVELFHGRTMAFKDLALSVVGNLLNYFLSKSGQHITILIGTSGDTGSAAIESVRGRECIDIIVLLPHGRCTVIQELQMTTVIEDNVHVYCVEGNSDELDKPIKQCFADKEFVSAHNLISINSINWGRIMAQVAHFFFTYYQLSGCIAQKMGLPITLVSGVNINDSVSRAIEKGDFSLKDEVYQSLAPAMDIQVSFLVSIESIVVDDARITEVMQRIHEEHKYVVCPHTAVAAAYHYQRKSDAPRGYIATASPAKFPEAVEKAKADPVIEGVDHLKYLPTKFQWMKKGEDWYSILRSKIEVITENMKNKETR